MTRRKSTGDDVETMAPGMLPSELVKRPIFPLNVPLASQQLALPALASSENELIVNKLEAIDERKDPGWVWVKVTKYTVYPSRIFGTFNASIGRGVYGIEMQMALRRQAIGLTATFRDLKIRVPLANRITSFMALRSWGAEGGKTGPEESIMLGDCFPMDTRSFEQFRVSGGN